MAADGSAHSPQPTAHEVVPGCSIDRRTFIKGTAASMALAVGGTASSTSASAQLATYPMPITGPVALFRGFGALADLGDESGEDLHTRIYADAVELEENRGPALNSIRDNVTMLKGYVRNNMAFEIADRTKAGDSEADVLAAAESVVSANAADIQGKLYNLWATDFLASMRRAEQVRQDGSLTNYGSVFYLSFYDGTGITTQPVTTENNVHVGYWDSSSNSNDSLYPWEWTAQQSTELAPWNDIAAHTVTTTLLDGSQSTLPAHSFIRDDSIGFVPTAELSSPTFEPGNGTSYTDTLGHLYEFLADRDEYQTIVDENGYTDASDPTSDAAIRFSAYPLNPDPEDDAAVFFDVQKFVEIDRNIRDLHDELQTEAQNLVDLLYQPIVDGEVNAHDIASGEAILQAADNAEDWQDMAGYYRAVNFPEAEKPGTIMAGELTLEGAMFWTSPSGDGLPVGSEIDPSNTIGELHIAAEIVDGPSDQVGDLITHQLQNPFTIESVKDDSETLHFEERDLTEPADTEEIIKRLQQAYDDERETRDGETNVSVTVESDPIGTGLLGNLGDSAGYLGLGLIGVTVLAVIGFVTDLIPGLGN